MNALKKMRSKASSMSSGGDNEPEDQDASAGAGGDAPSPKQSPLAKGKALLGGGGARKKKSDSISSAGSLESSASRALAAGGGGDGAGAGGGGGRRKGSSSSRSTTSGGGGGRKKPAPVEEESEEDEEDEEDEDDEEEEEDGDDDDVYSSPDDLESDEEEGGAAGAGPKGRRKGASGGKAAAGGAALGAAAAGAGSKASNSKGKAAEDEEEYLSEEDGDESPFDDDDGPGSDDTDPSSRSSRQSSKGGAASNGHHPSAANPVAREKAMKNAKIKNRPKRTTPRRDVFSLKYSDVETNDEELYQDMDEVRVALHLFLNSKMIEAEEICLEKSDTRLYYSVGFTLIQVIKSLMTFEPDDLNAAIGCCKETIYLASLHRKRDMSLGKLVRGSSSSSTMGGWNLIQRHAELIFAEATLLKAVLGIIYSGDFIAFLKEALNMRNAYAIYRNLAKFVEESKDLDSDFTSGVFLGNGLISMILSLLPSKVLKIMEVFGFTGDRDYALKTLARSGGWSSTSQKPRINPEEEGLRRQICDLSILLYHLVIGTYLPVTGVDIHMADKILHYNLDRYPEGVFFLYFSGRLYASQTLIKKAVKQYHKAIVVQEEYIQLKHICYWDLGICHLALCEFDKANECYNILEEESNWSKAIYAYSRGATKYDQGGKKNKESAAAIMAQVPQLMQRIAGKSIPLEKLVARKSRKFIAQGNRAVLPAIELSYFWDCLSLAPIYSLFDSTLDRVSQVLADLHDCKEPSAYVGGEDEYWEDFCLAHFLRGVALSRMTYPPDYVVRDPPKAPIPQKEAAEQAMISFRNIFTHGPKIKLDHYLVYFAHYEQGKLLMNMQKFGEARAEFDLLMSGKVLAGKKGKKVSMQNMVVLRTNAALQSLETLEKKGKK